MVAGCAGAATAGGGVGTLAGRAWAGVGAALLGVLLLLWHEIGALGSRPAGVTLMLVSAEGYVHDRFGDEPEELQRRIDCFAHARVVTVPDCGHNLQHDQPEVVAAALEDFLDRETP